MDHFGLEHTDDGFGERVIIGIANAADRWRGAGCRHAPLKRGIPGGAVAVYLRGMSAKRTPYHELDKVEAVLRIFCEQRSAASSRTRYSVISFPSRTSPRSPRLPERGRGLKTMEYGVPDGVALSLVAARAVHHPLRQLTTLE